MPETLDFRNLGREAEGGKWIATIWPTARESFFAIGSQNIGSNLDWWDAAWHYRTYLEPLLDSGTPLRHMGMFLLLIGLAAKEPGEHGLATDAAIAAVQDGRLGSDNLGEALAEHLPTNHFLLTRLAMRFQDISQVSELHGYVVLRAFERGLRGDPKQYPRGLGDILQMLGEIAAELDAGIDDPECRVFLEQLAGSSKAAKGAKALLKLKSETSYPAIVQQAIEHRIERLKAWQLCR